MRSPLRIAMTLPGEASLGAFQAGAMSALVVALQRRNADPPGAIVLDAMTATSSGSLTAVLGAYALLSGQDPVAPLRRAWVIEPTVDALRGRDQRAPLTLDRAREVATELILTGVPPAPSAGAQTEPIHVNFALTSLRGFTYEIPGPGQSNGNGTPATTHLDWAEHELTPKAAWRDVVDSAIASASHPAAFPPILLDRGALKERYEENGVKEFPECPVIWYADGGLLDREPLGRCLKLVHGEVPSDGSRVVLLLRPEPDIGLKSGDPAWTEADDAPNWTTTLGRALRIVVTHSLYEDLRRVERVNTRIRWNRDVTTALAKLIRPADNAKAMTTLGAVLEDIRREKNATSTGGPRERDTPAGDLRGRLEQVLAEASGLAGKRPIDVHVVSAAAPAKVAGGSLLNFGGFLSERLRANDFMVGYLAMVTWMRGCSAFEGAPLDAAEARATTIPGWIGGLAGRRTLSWRDRAHVLRIAGRAARIGLRGSDTRRV